MSKRPGRKRKTNVDRYPGGQIVKPPPSEVERQIVETAMKWRAERVGKDWARHPSAGYSLGRLYLQERISEPQHRAGVKWAELCADFRWAITAPGLTPKASSWLLLASGFAPSPTAPETEQERANRLDVCQRHGVALAALREADTSRKMRGYPATRIVQEVCVMDRDENTLTESQVGELRVGLNALVRIWGLTSGRPYRYEKAG